MKTAPHLRLTKAAHDTILALDKPRQRAPLLALMVALLRAENDDRQDRGEPFSVAIDELSRASGLSPGTVAKLLPVLTNLGLLQIESGKFHRRKNTYCILDPGAPPRRALADAPKSFEEIHTYVCNHGLEIPGGTLRVFWETNEGRDWMISNGRDRPARPCRDWRKLLVGFAKAYQPPAATPGATGGTNTADGNGDQPSTKAAFPSHIRHRYQTTALAEMPEPMCARAEVLCLLLDRSRRLRWSAEECASYRSSGIDDLDDATFQRQLDDVTWYYDRCAKGHNRGSGDLPIDGRRAKLIDLIRHWPDEVGKAQKARDRTQHHRPADGWIDEDKIKFA